MTGGGSELVLDTGPLSHLAQAGWLGVLRVVAGERSVVIPDLVEAELRGGAASRPHLQTVLQAEWIGRRVLESSTELIAYAQFAENLVADGRNQGETAVLAYASVHGAVAVIDDGAGRSAAQRAGVALKGTLGLLCDAIRLGELTVAVVAQLADHLLETEYRLPFASGGSAEWAMKNDLVP
ncbi:nucleotide-binding protein [Cellulomonas hominis]